MRFFLLWWLFSVTIFETFLCPEVSLSEAGRMVEKFHMFTYIPLVFNGGIFQFSNRVRLR